MAVPVVNELVLVSTKCLEEGKTTEHIFGSLSPDGDGLGARVCARHCRFVLLIQLVHCGLALKEAALLDWATSGGSARKALVFRVAELTVVSSEMGNVLGHGMLRSNGASVDTVSLAGFGKGVVARVEVLAILEVFCEDVRARRELSIETEEALLFRREVLERTTKR